MRKYSFSRFALLGLLAMAIVGAGCSNHVKPTPAQPTTTQPAVTAPPARPTVTLQASSTFIQNGESTTLTWSSTNATTLTVSPTVGSVAPEGSSKVSPTESTTYTITATGPGGTAEDTKRITVAAAAVKETAPTSTDTIDTLFLREVHDAYFDYNKADLRPDAHDALAQSAQFLRTHPEVKVIIEGYCDERGTTEYNLGLGQKRADAVKQFLVSLGIQENRVATTSFGKEKPFCNEHTEACWQQNRRGHFVKAP
jgi:peptidoglycan-associated lipoprotein